MFDSLESTGGIPEKFTLRLPPGEANDLDEVASWSRRSKSDVLRTLVRWSHKLCVEFYRQYPGDKSIFGGLDNILAGQYAASKLAMLRERGKEDSKLEAWRQARELEGEKVNYRLTGRALEFYMNAWERGQTVDELLKKYAEAAGSKGGPVVEEAEPVRFDAEPAEPAEKEPAAGGADWAVDWELVAKRLLVVVGVLVLVVVVMGILLAVRVGC